MATLNLASMIAASKTEEGPKRKSTKDLPTGTFQAKLTGIEDSKFHGDDGEVVYYKIVTFVTKGKSHKVSLSRFWFVDKEIGRTGRTLVASLLSKGNSIEVTMTSFEDEPAEGRTNGRRGYEIKINA